MAKDAYAQVTDRILAKLEAGVVPWHRPWTGGSRPRNLISGRAYHGINAIVLGCQGFASPYWLSFRKAQQLGGHVRRGERGTPVVFWKWMEEPEREGHTGEDCPRRYALLRYYTVFNADQCEGLSHRRLEESEDETAEFSAIGAAEAIVAGYVDGPQVIENGGDRACYNPKLDVIEMPERRRFDSEPHFYATLFHEQVHSTGHGSRLDRDEITGPIYFGSEPYSREELVAEMGSAFLLAESGIDSDGLFENSAAYVASWLKRLQDDRRLVVIAAARAQKAVDRILGSVEDESEE